MLTLICRAELEKLGQKYRIALRIARDERWERLKCDHHGVYADDCLVERVQKHKSKPCLEVVYSQRSLDHQSRETFHSSVPICCLLGALLTFEIQVYIVATNDRDLKRRIRKIPGVSFIGSFLLVLRCAADILISIGTDYVCRSGKIHYREIARCTGEVEQSATPSDINNEQSCFAFISINGHRFTVIFRMLVLLGEVLIITFTDQCGPDDLLCFVQKKGASALNSYVLIWYHSSCRKMWSHGLINFGALWTVATVASKRIRVKS